MGKSTISMAIFHCYVSSPEGKHHKNQVVFGHDMDFSIPRTAEHFEDENFEGAAGQRRVSKNHGDLTIDDDYTGNHAQIWVNYNELTTS